MQNCVGSVTRGFFYSESIFGCFPFLETADLVNISLKDIMLKWKKEKKRMRRFLLCDNNQNWFEIIYDGTFFLKSNLKILLQIYMSRI